MTLDHAFAGSIPASRAMEIVRYHAEDVPLGLYSRLHALTMGENGSMWSQFQRCTQHQRGLVGRVAIGKVDGKIRSWSLLWKYERYGSWHLYSYTQPEFRRQGLGTEIAQAIMKPLRTKHNVWVSRWDPGSRQFWNHNAKLTDKIKY